LLIVFAFSSLNHDLCASSGSLLAKFFSVFLLFILFVPCFFYNVLIAFFISFRFFFIFNFFFLRS
jgi:hypothetical protein